jgi:hypothetical protein
LNKGRGEGRQKGNAKKKVERGENGNSKILKDTSIF